MKRPLTAAIVLAGAWLALAQTPPPTAPPPIRPAALQDDIAVFFSPDGSALPAIVKQIGSARRTIEVQAFILSSWLFAKPLIEAQRRGVEVTVVFDREQADEEYSLDEALAEAGVKVFYDQPSDDGSNHNKVMIIDRRTLITGSMNFSRSAQEDNAENVLMIQNKRRIIDAYVKDFETRLAASTPATAP